MLFGQPVEFVIERHRLAEHVDDGCPLHQAAGEAARVEQGAGQRDDRRASRHAPAGCIGGGSRLRRAT